MVGKHEPIWLNISSIFLNEPVFICDTGSQLLGALLLLRWRILLGRVDSRWVSIFTILLQPFRKLQRVLSTNNNRRRLTLAVVYDRESIDNFDIDDDQDITVTSQFPSTQKGKIIELQKHFQRYVKTLPVSGFNSAIYDLKFIKSYLIPLLVNEKTRTKRHQKSKSFCIFQFSQCSIPGYHDLSWRSN